ncbi:MAG: DUF2399 domain-containing protein [Anaerolineales bacterium]|nr:DUF2399 domain-containing protein [Anaerolineales bacterium]
MSSDLPPVARAVLERLLELDEQVARQTVARVRLTAAHYPDYFSGQQAAPRQAANSALSALADQGWVRLHWVKHEIGNWLAAVDLVPGGAAALYALLGRTPRAVQAAALRALLAEQTIHSAWQASFIAWVDHQLQSQRSVAPLALDDPRANRDLLGVVGALAQLRAPMLERLFSTQVLGDSKRFGLLRGKVLTVLRRHAPTAADFGDDENSLLRAFGLERVPEYVALSGPLVLSYHAQLFDLTGFSPSLALSAAMLRLATVADCAAQAVITVENATSFSELTHHRPAEVLAIYTGGFASPAVIALLQQLQQGWPRLAFYHWGDLDGGGLRILTHLRKHLAHIGTLGMNVATFDRYRRLAQPLTAGDQQALMAMQGMPALVDCADLIGALLNAGLKLEQEAIPVNEVLQQLLVRR